MGRADIILLNGPEDHGNFLLERILVKMTDGGKAVRTCQWDHESWPEGVRIWGTNTPDHIKWDSWDTVITLCEERGLSMQAVVCMRNPMAAARSMQARGHAISLHYAMEKIAEAYRVIFSLLKAHEIPIFLVSYSELCERPDVVIPRLASFTGGMRLDDELIEMVGFCSDRTRWEELAGTPV